ncbi:hypothetical protein GGR54DRAFT_614502 [Hypoxylon sp. NC1633]|nr:hypothetical protein GGR54DRAFT_614502 [Hypoxylon sp. NC1633]
MSREEWRALLEILPDGNGDPIPDIITLPKQLSTLIDRFRKRVSGCTSINFRTYRPILTGEIFDIVSNDESLLPSYDILQLQWDLLRMVSLNRTSEEQDDEPPEARARKAKQLKKLAPGSFFPWHPSCVMVVKLTGVVSNIIITVGGTGRCIMMASSIVLRYVCM